MEGGGEEEQRPIITCIIMLCLTSMDSVVH